MDNDPHGQSAVDDIYNAITELWDWGYDKLKKVGDATKEIYADLKNIGFNVFNSDVQKILDSKHISFYKGQLVIRENWGFTNARSGSFGVMFLNSEQADADTVNHEYGHFLQLQTMGLNVFITQIAIPSLLSDPYADDYYSAPWERSADIFGGVDRGNYTENSDVKAIAYLGFCLLLK
ncbi:MAG: hypothetical protein Q4A83_05495 [Bacillota bacterium]|nr:hypothetical protein [Bacillota bacterium]